MIKTTMNTITKRVSQVAAIASMAILFSACSLTPQKLNVEPMLDFAAVKGIEIPVQITVVDKREEADLLGYRNAKKEGAIGFTKPLAATLEAQIIKALQAQGANTAKSPEPATEIAIEIHHLSYVTPDESWVSHIKMKGEILLNIQRGLTNLKKRSSVNQSQDVVTAPSQDFNEMYLNALLTQLINKAMNDKEVVGFIK